MSDNNLRDDMLKLVQYQILFLKRDYEHAFPEQEELVADNLDAAGYTAWKIATFIQQLSQRKITITIPKKWKHYPPNDPKYREGRTLVGFPEEDKKYLRVYYKVLDRRLRETYRFEERQIDVLKQIRDRLPGRRPPRAPGVREQVLNTLRDQGMQSVEELARHTEATVADVQAALDTLEREGQVGRWEGQYGLREQVDQLRTVTKKILDTLQAKGDLQTREQLEAGFSAEELAQVDKVLSNLVSSEHIQQRRDRYGFTAWTENLPTVGTQILEVLRRAQRYLTVSELRDATGEPFAAMRASLTTLEANDQVHRRGSRYGLPE